MSNHTVTLRWYILISVIRSFGKHIASRQTLVDICRFRILSYLKDGKFGTFMLMSPMLMFLGISGRFMFFTADTARAGAPAIPAYTHTKHPQRVEKIEISLGINTTNDHT